MKGHVFLIIDRFLLIADYYNFYNLKDQKNLGL